MTLEPTKSELEILKVLWQNGPSTVRAVNDKLNESRPMQYTTTLKLMQIMFEKGLLTADKSSMKHIYKANVEESKTKSVLLDKFVDSIYGGSKTGLMMQLLGNEKASPEELSEIRKLLDKLENEQR